MTTFSAVATLGLETKKQGEFSRKDLAPLAEVNVNSLKQYGYFTYAKVNGTKSKELFGGPVDYWLDYDAKETVLTLHFTLPFKAPMRATNLEIEVYDPDLSIEFAFAEQDPVRLTGAMQSRGCPPKRCLFPARAAFGSILLGRQRQNGSPIRQQDRGELSVTMGAQSGHVLPPC